LDNNQTVNNLGFASIYDQSRLRLLDPLMLLFTNHILYQSFVWNELVNLGLRGANTKLLLRRGFSEMKGYEGIRMKDEDQPVYDSYPIDSRATVNQLAAANARQTNDIFFTWTCNAKQTFGVRNITAFVESRD
jgi:hypothetical protein